MTTYLNKGISTEKISVFPSFVEEVDSTLCAFIGYTAKAERQDPGDLILVPLKISSFKEYERYFGKPFEEDIEIAVTTDTGGQFILAGFREPTLSYILSYCVRIYFENGGQHCYILSVGTYQNPPRLVMTEETESGHYGLLDGLNRLTEVADLSLVVIPEAVKLAESEYATMVQSVLYHCEAMGNRFAIFDLYQGDCANPDLTLNRSYFGSGSLRYGSVYYPFVKTMINFQVNDGESNVKVDFRGEIRSLGALRESNKLLARFVRNEIMKRFVPIPCSSAVAGIYVSTDIHRGVWKSSSNLPLEGIREPLVKIDDKMQEILYKDPEYGKSVNSIRSFADRGLLIWGARTLAGNDSEWRYIPACRFFIMARESLRKATQWVVCEPNEPKTWTKVIDMIENYLTRKWKDGALAGISPQTAFYVKCGAGSTMTDQDIQDGRILIEVGLAILRSGEFIVIRLAHQLSGEKNLIN